MIFQQLHDRLKEADNFLLTTHRGPDPDGLGSELGLDYLLREWGKKVVIVNHDPPPVKYRFLDTQGKIFNMRDRPPQENLEGRTVVLVDNSELKRTGDVEKYINAGLKTIIIDHHDGLESDYVTMFQSPGSAASCEMICEILQLAGVTPPVDVATAMYAGIVADTGSFRYGKTSLRTHMMAGWLLSLGVNGPMVHERLYASSPVERLLAKRELFNTLGLNQDRRMAWFKIVKEDVERLNLTFDDLDGVVNELLEPKDIQIAILFTQREKGQTRVSARSKGDTNLLPAVSKYGGGGHKNACGAIIPLDLDQAIREFTVIASTCLNAV